MFARLRPESRELTELHVAAGRPGIVARLLAARGFGESEIAALTPPPSPPPAQDIPGLQEVADEVLRFVADGGRLLVHGDYDVDGVSAAGIAAGALKELGHEVEVFLPHRLRDGYGLGPETLRRASARGVAGVLTVDCGISGHAAAELAQLLGLRLWITDHHLIPSELPKARVAHPGLLPPDHPLRYLSGAGVAYALARCWLGDEAALHLSDLAALGTLADQVPLLGENRRIVRDGLRQLREATRPGLLALLQEAGQSGEVDEETVAFRIAPRLNACGRMDTPDTAYRLLTAGTAEAPELARRAGELNRRRQEVEAQVLEAARAGASIAHVTIASGEGWHRGVIGIVAARLVEQHSQPAFVISFADGEAHGSARAPEGMPLMEALEEASALLTSYGGHRGAAGFRLPASNLAALARELQEFYRRSGARPLAPVADARLALREVTLQSVAALGTLRPFGSGNPEPVFLLEHAQVLDAQAIGGGRHTRLRLRDASGSAQAVHWRSASTERTHLDLLVAIEENAFRGDRSARLRVVAAAPSVQLELWAAAFQPPPDGGSPPAAVIDRRGRGVPQHEGLTHYFTLDATTAWEAASALGAGYYLTAAGREEVLMELLAAGRLRGVVGPLPTGLPVERVVALEHPASPGELCAVAGGLPLELSWRPEDEAKLALRAGAWEQTDEELRDAYRALKRLPEGRMSVPPDGPRLAAAWAIFRELGLIVEDRLTDRRVDISASPLRAAMARRAAQYRRHAALWRAPLAEILAAMGGPREAVG